MRTGVAVTRQLLSVQRTLTQNGLRTLALMQERSERVTRSFLASHGEDAPDGRPLWDPWSETGQAGCRVFQSAVDAYFKMLEGMLLPDEGQR